MEYDAIVSMLLRADREDWLRNDSGGTHVLRHDVRIWVEQLRDTAEDIVEDWHKGLRDPSAQAEYVVLRFGAVPVQTFRLVSVDGGRAWVPIPKWDGNLVRPLDLAIARAVDVGNTLDQYIERLKFEPGDW